MTGYQITVKNDKTKLYNRFTWLIISFNIIFLLYLTVTTTSGNIRTGAIAMLILLAIVFSLRLYFQHTKYRFGFHPFFLLLVLYWINVELYWLAGIVFIFDILSMLATRPLVFSFSKDKIIYPSYITKTGNWSELVDVILKDDLLTINFKNDRFIQQYIDETKTAVNEQEFNDFCRAQLNK